jgi:ABC-2 type transport system permease protein
MTLMNFFRFPTLFISGVFMPLASFPGWLLPLAMVSPLTYVTGLLRYGISGETWFTNPLAPTAVLAAFLAASWIITLKSFEKRSTR